MHMLCIHTCMQNTIYIKKLKKKIDKRIEGQKLGVGTFQDISKEKIKYQLSNLCLPWIDMSAKKGTS